MSAKALDNLSCGFGATQERRAEPISSARVLLVIPAFNEERTIARVLASAQAYINDILVIDDASLDATASIARAAGVMVHRIPRNMGKGEALKVGFAYAVEHD